MRTRVLSSIFVVLIGLVPTLLGGPVFAFLMIALGLGGFREYSMLTTRVGGRDDALTLALGSMIIVALGIGALVSAGSLALFAILAFAVAAPLVAQLPETANPDAFSAWSLASSGALYLGLPVYAAITLRSLNGTIEPSWFPGMSSPFAPGWNFGSLGLAWALTTILATWVGDSAAYLVGRGFGKNTLAPAVSPGKTIEGSIGGLIGSAAVGGMAFAAFDIGQWPVGLVVGAIIGLVGQFGDLSESFMKRQASTKDSGSLIPGHGGILDRLDALLFAFPTALLLASGLERLAPT